MDEVHSSSFKNIVQGEAVGMRTKIPLASWLGLFSFPVLTQLTSGADQSAVYYHLNSRDMKFRGRY